MADPKKPGWKTTEFWLTLAASTLSTMYLLGVIGDASAVGKVAAVIALALTNAGYTVSRGKLKAANAAGE